MATSKHCCVPQCNGNGKRHPELIFHKFPAQDELRKTWIVVIRRDQGPLFKVRLKLIRKCWQIQGPRGPGRGVYALSLCDLWQSRSTKSLCVNAKPMAFQRSYDSTLLHRRIHVLFSTVANASDLFILTPEFPLHKHNAPIFIQRIFDEIFRLLLTLYM